MYLWLLMVWWLLSSVDEDGSIVVDGRLVVELVIVNDHDDGEGPNIVHIDSYVGGVRGRH